MNYELRINNKAKYFFILLFLLFTVHCSLFTGKIYAQSAINLSISPPLFELIIKPGKDVKQLFTITNLGGDTFVTPKIVYFNPIDESGNVDLTSNEAPNWIIYNKDQFSLKGQEKLNFEVTFSPPVDIPQTDHFLTLVFETNEPVDLLGQSSIYYKSRIGANVLLTISEDGNPEWSAEILEFNAPKIVDSLFGQIEFNLKIKNNGNSFWKPIGKITTENQVLVLAPQNIISGHAREISCLDNKSLIECKLVKKFRVGKIVSELEFSLDKNQEIYKSEIVTYAFPFSIIGLTLILMIIKKGRARSG